MTEHSTIQLRAQLTAGREGHLHESTGQPHRRRDRPRLAEIVTELQTGSRHPGRRLRQRRARLLLQPLRPRCRRGLPRSGRRGRGADLDRHRVETDQGPLHHDRLDPRSNPRWRQRARPRVRPALREPGEGDVRPARGRQRPACPAAEGPSGCPRSSAAPGRSRSSSPAPTTTPTPPSDGAGSPGRSPDAELDDFVDGIVDAPGVVRPHVARVGQGDGEPCVAAPGRRPRRRIRRVRPLPDAARLPHPRRRRARRSSRRRASTSSTGSASTSGSPINSADGDGNLPGSPCGGEVTVPTGSRKRPTAH